MSLSAGTRLGPYEVVALLGVGGMGEVYRARDSRLNRDVAIKVLPGIFTSDSDRLARFQREAEVLASLNHPNIAAIYGLEEADGVRGLVLELVEGPTLAERLADGGRAGLPLDEVLPIVRQIADALEAAHDRGIVHRDLKPANIKVRPDGTVKVLDFGLAKLTAPSEGGASGGSPMYSQMATLSSPAMSRVGVILGTAAYMSPEQARGRTVDKRADLWAFGCVLFEMLTGKRTFGGDDMTDTIAAVVRAEPDWSALPANTPASIRRLLHRALAKDARNRLADASTARLEIDEALATSQGETTVAAERLRSHERVAWALVAVFALAATALSIPAARYLRGPAPSEPARFLMETPAVLNPTALQVSVSPDGRNVAYVSAEGGNTPLFVRPIDSVTARPLAGTEGASNPFWSPDSRYIGFSVSSGSNVSLMKVEAAGGAPQVICHAGGSGTWNRDDVIVFSNAGELHRVSAAGGASTRITTPDKSLKETAHYWPYFLPDGRHFLYLAWSTEPENRAVYVGALDSDQRIRVMTAESKVAYAPPGFLLFHRQGTLFAQAFDATRLALRGEPLRLAENIPFNRSNGQAPFAASSTGTLLFRSGTPAEVQQLVWFDREGRQLETVGQPGLYRTFVLSPDEKRVAFQRFEPGAPGADIWTLEISTGILSRLTNGPAYENEPAWAPDSRTVVFSSDRNGATEVFQRTLGGREDVRVFGSPDGSEWPDDWSRDGRFILINDQNTGIIALPTMGDRKPIRLLQSGSIVDEAQFSPDGSWVAYASTESGTAQIYVASFPDFKNIKQVSAGEGNEPHWRRDGKELFYLTSEGDLMAVGVHVAGANLETTAPKMLFATRVTTTTPWSTLYAVSADGRRFLVLKPVQGARPTPITVVLNWQSALEARERR